jgi:hypothetical protein
LFHLFRSWKVPFLKIGQVFPASSFRIPASFSKNNFSSVHLRGGSKI